MDGIYDVAPFAGAWIEMRKDARTGVAGRSLPSRERGLKCPYRKKFFPTPAVAPLAGAGIVKNVLKVIDYNDARRAPRGSVD